MSESATATAEAPADTKVKTTQTGDFIIDTASRVAAMGKVKALNRIEALLDTDGESNFELGGCLLQVKTNNWYEGHTDFNDFCEKRFGLQPRKARYLITIYECLVNNSIPWAKVKDLGWTKLREMTRVLKADNVDEWAEKARAMTVEELKAAIKIAEGKGDKDGEGTESTSTTSNISTLRFKLINDQLETVNQALAKAKAEGNTEHDNVALELICQAYLSGGTGPGLSDLMKSSGPEKSLETFDAIYGSDQLPAEERWVIAVTPPGTE